MKFKVLQKCYYGEGEQSPRFMRPGDIYESNTLKAKDTPRYLKAIDGVVAKEPVDYKSGTDGVMGYHEMKSFVAAQGWTLLDYKKETMETAIAEFKATGKAPVGSAEESADAGEGTEEGEVPAEVSAE